MVCGLTSIKIQGSIVSKYTIDGVRVKKIEYNNLNLSVEIPKNLALTSVAIRMVSFNADYLAAKFPTDFITLVDYQREIFSFF
jgi:hypothetical protein